jgi:hypothetical protein
MVTEKQNMEKKLRQEIKQWKETCEIVSDKDIMKSIQVSLKQIAEGKGMPLSQL